ncbi:hypothetical protein K7X08_038024 [Anisodus acutangulus]|uniref:Uncharacterized protein n=1 Tax=Anisodus acutangulus TaxID=402998 RepID=A0A9Q1N1F6_9SOLA|nr:hypothetical protein K7X08_038024 [Anisodus acutangulus]
MANLNEELQRTINELVAEQIKLLRKEFAEHVIINDAQHDGENDVYSFQKDDKKIRLIPLSPSEVKEMKIQNDKKHKGKSEALLLNAPDIEEESKNGSSIDALVCKEKESPMGDAVESENLKELLIDVFPDDLTPELP